MRAIPRIVLAVLILTATSHRLPAPISEESTPTPTAAPEQPAKAKQKGVAEPKPTPQAGNAQMGTWKLDESESTLAAGTGKNNKGIYKPVGDSVKVTVDGNDGSGKPVHSEWTGRFDGKDYPVSGDANFDSLSYNKIDDRTLEITAKKDGKVAWTSRILVSADGKSGI